jgi:hypothetical protein
MGHRLSSTQSIRFSGPTTNSGHFLARSVKVDLSRCQGVKANSIKACLAILRAGCPRTVFLAREDPQSSRRRAVWLHSACESSAPTRRFAKDGRADAQLWPLAEGQ